MKGKVYVRVSSCNVCILPESIAGPKLLKVTERCFSIVCDEAKRGDIKVKSSREKTQGCSYYSSFLPRKHDGHV